MRLHIRRVFFWLHLSAGVFIGGVVLVMAVTGILLAYEPQLVALVERDRRVVAPPSEYAARRSLDELLALARAAHADPPPSAVVVRADPRASVMIALGREQSVYLNPYSGAILGGHSGLHNFMHTVEDVHRWLGSRKFGRPVTGACALALLFMILSGLYLWTPQVWRRLSFRLLLCLDPQLNGPARQRNWHDVVGFWCAPLLLLTTITGIIMAYPWATNLLYAAAGSPPPPASQSSGGKPPPPEIPAISLDALAAQAVARAPGWATINIRFATKPGGPVTLSIQEPRAWGDSYRQSQITLNAGTGAEEKWESYAEASAGRKLRSWIKPIHTGQAAGWIGQTVALVSPTALCVLVWTGFALARRRLRRARAVR